MVRGGSAASVPGDDGQSEVAPPPPESESLPPSYIALRCQFCGRWSSSLSPWEPLESDKVKWGNLYPWGMGDKLNASGLTCRICLNVHSAGGWSREVGTLKKVKVLFLKEPTKAHSWRKQADRLIELKVNDPTVRIRSSEQLGPRTAVDVTKSSVLKVTGPQAYFVELTVYSEVTGDTPEKIQYQELGGATKPCIRCVGKTWKDLFEDGHDGVYLISNESQTSVSKTCRVNQPDIDLESAESIFGRMRQMMLGFPQPNASSKLALANQDGKAGDDDMSGFWASFGQGGSSSPPDAAPKPKAKARGGKKQKAPEASADAEAHEDKRRRVSSLVSLNPNQNGEPRRFLSFGKDNEETIPALSGDSDQKWQDEFDSKLVGALSVQMKYENPADESETAYCRSCICDAQKVLTSLLNQVKSRRRNLGRRSVAPAEGLVQWCDERESAVKSGQDLLKLVSQATFSGDEAMVLLASAEALGAAPDSAFRLKIAKGLVLDDLKWARWPTMLSVTLPMAKKHSKEPDRWFSQQMCLTLQRIVKSIGVDKVSFGSDDMKALSAFVVHMAQNLPIQDLRHEFKCLLKVLECESGLPKDVLHCVELVRSSAASAEFRLLASLEGLPQGKKILELAAAVAEGRKQTHQHLEKFQELDEELTRLFSAFPKDVCSNSDMESAIRVQTMVHECTKVDGQVSSSAEFSDQLAKLQARVDEFVTALAHVHLRNDLVPWAAASLKSLESSKSMTAPETSPLRKLEDHFPKHVLLKQLISFEDSLADIAKLLCRMESKTVEAHEVCGSLRAWSQARSKLGGVENAERFVELEQAVLGIATAFYQKSLSTSLSDAVRIIDGLCKQGKAPESSVTAAAMDKCEQAEVVASGLDEPCSRNSWATAIKVARNWLALADSAEHKPTEHHRQCVCLRVILASLGVDVSFEPAEVKVDECAVRKAGASVFKVLYQDWSAESHLENELVFQNGLVDLLHQGLSAFTHAREKMATCLAKAVERGDAISLPELSEDSMDAFCLACDKAGEELVNACGAVESACRMCRQGLALLDFKEGDSEVELFLPMLPKARHLSKTLLLHAACHSAVKIVKSKAAQRGLNDSARKASQCLKFAQDNSIEMPGFLQAKLTNIVSAVAK